MTETTITTPSWVQALDKYVASKPIEDVAAYLNKLRVDSNTVYGLRIR